MVATIDSATSIKDKDTDSRLGRTEETSSSTRTTSVDGLYRYDSDPDLLIRAYFRFSPQRQRANLRKTIAGRATNLREVLKILDFSRQNDIYDAYDAGIDLLAEFEDIKLLVDAVNHLESVSRILNKSQLKNLDDFWEVLIKGIAYAHKIPSEERLNLLLKVLDAVPFVDRRQFKIAIIDSLESLSDELEPEVIAGYIRRFVLSSELDEYVQSYAQELLQDLS